MFPGEAIRRDADFFSDLGGHSLFAARLVSQLRADTRLATMTVQDIPDKNCRIGKIADAMLARMQADCGAQAAFKPSPNNSRLRRVRCGMAQRCAFQALHYFHDAMAGSFFTYHIYTGSHDDSDCGDCAVDAGVCRGKASSTSC